MQNECQEEHCAEKPLDFSGLIVRFGGTSLKVVAAKGHARRLLGVSVLLILTAGPALAQPDLEAKYRPVLDQCLAQGGKVACIGKMAQACIAGEPGGETTLGTSQCYGAEAAAWDRRLNDAYRKKMAEAKAMDAEDKKYAPNFAIRVSQLRDAQRAWIKFRDAECALEYAMWGMGSMRQIAGAQCLMEMTAKRTLALEAL